MSPATIGIGIVALTVAVVCLVQYSMKGANMNHKIARLGQLSGLVLLMFASACAVKSPTTPDARDDTVGDYVIGPGDQLKVFVWRNPELSAEVPVRPDGKISTPLVEDMVAVGKTPTDLSRDMEEVLAKYVRTPVVNVIVTDFVGTFGNQIRVVGEATNPQALPYRENITLLDVMIEVGGLTDFAAGNSAKIVRRRGGKVNKIPVELDDLLNDGDIAANEVMAPGDVLIIPESWF